MMNKVAQSMGEGRGGMETKVEKENLVWIHPQMDLMPTSKPMSNRSK